MKYYVVERRGKKKVTRLSFKTSACISTGYDTEKEAQAFLDGDNFGESLKIEAPKMKTPDFVKKGREIIKRLKR